jgi:hypothetical protein
MGAPKGQGYTKKASLTGTGSDVLEQLLQQSGQDLGAGGNLAQNPLYQQAVEGTRQFLPGGQGFAPIQAEAQRNFQQQTIPSILNSFGSGAKGSSALNQALAGAGQNLNSSLASMLAQMQLQASGQASTLAQQPYQQGLQGANLGLGTSPFAYMQRASPFWQDLSLALVGAAGKAGAAKLGATSV